MRTKREPTKKKRPLLPETGVWGFLGVTIILLAIIYYGRDYYDIRLGLLGAYAWGLAIGLAFGLTLIYHALFMLPKRGEAGWREAMLLLLTYYFRQAIRLLTVAPKPKATRPGPGGAYIPVGFTKVSAGIIESHQAAALIKKGIFTRADGPGFVKLNREERVGELVDLRKHLRTQRVTAVTRDGIPVEATVIVIFQLQPSRPENAPPDRQYWYNEDAIFRALYTGSIDALQRSRHWTERPAPIAADHLVATVATYTLDELIQPVDPAATPIAEVKTRVKHLVSNELETQGIQIMAIALSQLTLPDNVVQERINAWQAEWERHIQTEQVTGNAEAWRRIQLARARAQMEIIDNITSSIEMMCRRGGVDISEVVTLRMIEALETAASDDAVKVLIPNHVLSSLSQIQAWMSEPTRLLDRQFEE